MQTRRPRARCRFCGRSYTPRIRRQIYCGSSECFRNRRRIYMKRYMAQWKSRHADYWKTERQYEYLRRWRESHPHYFRNWRRRKRS
jgi:hypothetical protein